MGPGTEIQGSGKLFCRKSVRRFVPLICWDFFADAMAFLLCLDLFWCTPFELGTPFSHGRRVLLSSCQGGIPLFPVHSESDATDVPRRMPSEVRALPVGPTVSVLFLTVVASISLSFVYAFLPFMVVAFPELGLQTKVWFEYLGRVLCAALSAQDERFAHQLHKFRSNRGPGPTSAPRHGL